MKISTFLSLLLCLFFCSSCSILKNKKLYKAGAVSSSNFIDSVPFDYSRGFPIINIEIEGEEYRFLFDTGAPCCISTEIYEKLGLQEALTFKVGDSNGDNQKLIQTKVKKIKVGNTHFTDLAAVVADINSEEIFNCMQLDGVIGANLMRQAKWEIDYQTKTLRFSDDLKKLNTEGENYLIDFYTVLSGTPKISITVDGVKVEDVTFDTGSAGYLSLPNKKFKKLYLNSNTRRAGYGVTGYGLYGASAYDTSFVVKTKNITVGNLSKSGKVIDLENFNKEILGNVFLENYRVILNWETEHITIYPIVDAKGKNENLRSFGFFQYFKDNKITVSFIYLGSSAEKAGLKIGDEIIKIEGLKTTDLTPDERCDLLFKSYDDLDSISLVVLRNGNEINLTIEKYPFF